MLTGMNKLRIIIFQKDTPTNRSFAKNVNTWNSKTFN